MGTFTGCADFLRRSGADEADILMAEVVQVTVSVTHGKVWHFDLSSPATDDMNSLFDYKLPEFHARLDQTLNQ